MNAETEGKLEPTPGTLGVPLMGEQSQALTRPLSNRRPWLAIVFLALAQFMLVVDDTVVNVALPSIQRDLKFTVSDLVWVVNAYIVPYGGMLLLGGRLADRFGRRLIFSCGLVTFVLASVSDGFATSDVVLLGSRAVQGLGAALVAPAGLAMTATLFDSESDRTRALGIWGGLAGLGLTVGVLLGGAITGLASWRWIFFINLPLGLVALLGTYWLVPERRQAEEVGFDWVGGAAVTIGVAALLWAAMRLPGHGFDRATASSTILAAAALAAFAGAQRLQRFPLIPRGLLGSSDLRVALLLSVLIPAAFFAMFFLLTLHMQSIWAYSPMQAGAAYLGFAGAVMVGMVSSAQLVLRFGARWILTCGMALSAVGLLLLTRLSPDGTYVRQVLPGMIPLGVGGAWSMVTVTIVALARLSKSRVGIASGFLTAAQQVGGAVGLGLIVAISRWSGQKMTTVGAANIGAVDSRFAFIIAASICSLGALLAAWRVPSGLNKAIDPTIAAASRIS